MKINNELKFFTTCDDAYEYLGTSDDQPFIIICDMNIPRMNGLEFKKQIDENEVLRMKSIPFVFITTFAQKQVMNAAYQSIIV